VISVCAVGRRFLLCGCALVLVGLAFRTFIAVNFTGGIILPSSIWIGLDDIIQ